MFQFAAKLSDLDATDILSLEVNGVPMVLYRSGDSLRACQRYCPHQNADLSEGIISNGFLVCSGHGWRFHADTGVHELSPQTCLATYKVEVEGDNILINPMPKHNMAVPHD